MSVRRLRISPFFACKQTVNRPDLSFRPNLCAGYFFLVEEQSDGACKAGQVSQPVRGYAYQHMRTYAFKCRFYLYVRYQHLYVGTDVCLRRLRLFSPSICG